MTLPKGWREATIAEIIPEAALAELMPLIDAGKRSARDFKPVLAKYRVEMERNGVIPEFAAYALEHAIAQANR